MFSVFRLVVIDISRCNTCSGIKVSQRGPQTADA